MRLLHPQRSLPAWLFGVVLVVTSIAVFVPLLPSQPEAGLDPSWAFGMNQAVAQGLRFGHDVIFSFGPYAALYTWLFHPATDGLMVLGGLWIAAGFTVAAYLTLRREPWSLQICFLLAMAAVTPLRDALFFVYPLLVGMLVCGMNPEQRPLRSAPLLALLMVPLGLMPLVKQSMFLACLVAVIVSAMMLVYRRQWRLLFTALSVPLVSIALFWILSGQSTGDLWPYFASGTAVISGYTQAMALDGNPFEAIAYTLAAVFIIARVAQGGAGEDRLTRGCRSLLFAGLLFLAFKAGFVRHDIHGLIAASFVLLCTLLVAQTRSRLWHDRAWPSWQSSENDQAHRAGLRRRRTRHRAARSEPGLSGAGLPDTPRSYPHRSEPANAHRNHRCLLVQPVRTARGREPLATETRAAELCRLWSRPRGSQQAASAG